MTLDPSFLRNEAAAAQRNRATFLRNGVVVVEILGGPGCGKTRLIDATLDRLGGVPVGVVMPDGADRGHARMLSRHSAPVVEVGVGDGSFLTAQQLERAAESLDPSVKLLLVEGLGNLIRPRHMDLGQDARVVVFSVGGGDDKAARHPQLVREASVLLLTKNDLLGHTPFDRAAFRSDVQAIRDDVPLFELSALDGTGMDGWLDWLHTQLQGKQLKLTVEPDLLTTTDWWLG